MTQIELHKKIREVLQKNHSEIKREGILELISANFDTKNYFFAKADEHWLSWLWNNRFLDVIKQKSENPTRYNYRTPELRYLVRMVEKVPVIVIKIISSKETATTKENFNPEVIDQFLQICSKLPANQLAKMVPKIKQENWVKLMSPFSQLGFEYKEMFQKLAEAKDYENLLKLAEVVLAVREKREQSDKFLSGTPFYFNDLSSIEVFKYLLLVNDINAEKALKLAAKTMTEIVNLGDKSGNSKVFPIQDNFHFHDVDFFDLKLDEKKHLSYQDDVIRLAAAVKTLAERLIGPKCAEPETTHDIYEKYIKTLPNSRLMWRLKLFILSLCPEVFKKELKKAFFRLFAIEHHYNELISGTEYLKALRVGFPVLSNDDKREYVKKVIDYFTKKDRGKKNRKDDWRYDSRVLSIIDNYLNDKEKQMAKNAGFMLDPSYEPESSIDQILRMAIEPRGPVTQEEFDNLHIRDIANKLRKEWAPKKLCERNISDDFLNPLSAKDVSQLLKNDISKRFQEYIDNANLFFDRKELDSRYTYPFLREIHECIRENKVDFSGANLDNLITLCISIKNSGENQPFNNEKRGSDTFDAWFASWTAVHSAMADVIQELLSDHNGQIVINFSKYRNHFFEIISYLLKFPDPTPKDEQIETDPFTMAINTVRGRAFEDFVLFIYQDGKGLESKKIKIKDDVRKIYAQVLEKENTRALMFMLGHYLPSFYFRDRKWVQSLLPQIFSKEPEKKHLYTAAWEGYLSSNLYKEIFFDSNIQKLYERGLDLTDIDYPYPKQEYFKNPDEAVAVHLALAFVHFSEFDFSHKLFKKFWEIKNIKRHKEFISFIGRHSLSRDGATEWIKNNKIDVKKLIKFWNWTLKNISEPEVLSGFSFWINPNMEVLSDELVIKRIAETLKKSKGKISRDYELLRRLPIFAEKDSKTTLEIICNYLLDKTGKNLNSNRRMPFLRQDEIKKAMKIIYKNENEKTKQNMANLINILIQKGSSTFWDLENIIKQE